MRKWHRLISVATVLPFLLTLLTGIVLMTRSFNPLLSSTDVKLEKGLGLTLEQIVEKAAAVPESGIKSVADISRLDMRLNKGEIRIRPAKSKMHILMNAHTGEILSTEQPISGFLVSLHEGAFFGDLVQFGVFLPSSIGVLFLMISGIVLFLVPYQTRRRNKARAAPSVIPPN